MMSGASGGDEDDVGIPRPRLLPCPPLGDGEFQKHTWAKSKNQMGLLL